LGLAVTSVLFVADSKSYCSEAAITVLNGEVRYGIRNTDTDMLVVEELLQEKKATQDNIRCPHIMFHHLNVPTTFLHA
jgi:hypothetical protein